MVACAVATGTIAASQVIFEILGDRYFFTNGRIIDSGPISNAEPIEIEGFTISAFSGTYLGHGLWVMPLVFMLGAVAAVARAPNLPEPTERLVYFSAVGALVVLAVHESQPLFYYNVRYLTYIWPFVFVLSWCAFATVDRRAVGRPVTAALVVLLLAGAAVVPFDPVEFKRVTESRVVELLDLRDELLGRRGRIVVFRRPQLTQLCGLCPALVVLVGGYRRGRGAAGLGCNFRTCGTLARSAGRL